MTEGAERPCSWLGGTGPEIEYVISSRVRLARNLSAVSFPGRATADELQAVVDEVRGAAKRCPKLEDASLVDMNALDSLDRQYMLERRLVSNEFAASSRQRALLLSGDETVSLMINEEDHLRLQCFAPGLQPRAVWESIDMIDNCLDQRLQFAFDSELGYLTACPTNTGTGMRVSVMLHLPALGVVDEIGNMLEAISKVGGLTVRGLYGEGSEILGDFYQISNQTTLGVSEMDLIRRVESITHQIIEAERQTRQRITSVEGHTIEDRIWRSYGVLRYARSMSFKEAIQLLSLVKLGVHIAVLQQVDHQIINELIFCSQSAHVQKMVGRELTPEERDEYRATFIRGHLSDAHP